MCRITTYSPLKAAGVKKGDKVAIAGFGGLGHMALQYAVSFGAEVVIFDRTEDKRELANQLGAVKYVNINNAEDIADAVIYAIETPSYVSISKILIRPTLQTI